MSIHWPVIGWMYVEQLGIVHQRHGSNFLGLRFDEKTPSSACLSVETRTYLIVRMHVSPPVSAVEQVLFDSAGWIGSGRDGPRNAMNALVLSLFHLQNCQFQSVATKRIDDDRQYVAMHIRSQHPGAKCLKCMMLNQRPRIRLRPHDVRPASIATREQPNLARQLLFIARHNGLGLQSQSNVQNESSAQVLPGWGPYLPATFSGTANPNATLAQPVAHWETH